MDVTRRPEHELLERGEELATLTRALERVHETRSGRVVLVAGEAGIGKTTLLRRFCAERSERVLWGACDPLFTPRPLGPWLDISESVGGDVARLMTSDPRPFQVASAILRDLTASEPTILVLDDLHWADEATLDVVRLIVGRIREANGLLVAAYRDEALPATHPLRLTLGDLSADTPLVRVAPGALSRRAVAALTADTDFDADRLFSLTEGNPFFVTEVLAGGSDELPMSVRDAVIVRSARLTPEARRLLDAVAIVPQRCELWLLAALAGEDLARLEECVESGILTLDPSTVAFRHELARIAVEEAIPTLRRIALHRDTLLALTQPGRQVDPARLAHHAEAAHDGDVVLRFAPLAAERAAQLRSHREAAAQLARALRFATRAPLEVRAKLHHRRAHECYLNGAFDEAIGDATAALQAYRALGDVRREGDVLRSLSRLIRFVGRPAEAKERGREAVELLERLPPGHELAMAYANLAHIGSTAEDQSEVTLWGERAMKLARRLEDEESFLYTLTSIGTLEHAAGEPGGRAKLEQVIDRGDRAGLDEHAGRGYLNLVWWATRDRRYDVVEEFLKPGLTYSTERDIAVWRVFFLACRARVELDRGQWNEAAVTARSVLRDPHTWSVPRTVVLVVDALVRLRRGDAAGRQTLDAEWEVVEPSGELQRIGWVATALAEAAWLGFADSQHVDVLTAGALDLAVQRRRPWVAGELMRWRSAIGLPVPPIHPPTITEPWASQLAGDWAAAAGRWEQLGCPYEEALALAGAPDPATVRHALEILLRLDARPAAAIVSRRLRTLGASGIPRGPRTATLRNPGNLTSRELEVLGLLRQGLRNREIAERLVVSEKTVDHHVSAILAKLGVSSRAAAIAEAARLGIATDAAR